MKLTLKYTPKSAVENKSIEFQTWYFFKSKLEFNLNRLISVLQSQMCRPHECIKLLTTTNLNSYIHTHIYQGDKSIKF